MLLSIFIFFLEYPAAVHALLFLILLFSGIGIGLLPEDVTLLLGGYLSYLGLVGFIPTLIILTIAILAADTAGYFTGRFYGAWLENNIVSRWKFARDITERVKQMFARHGEKVVIISRPLFAVRVAIPMFAGHTRMDFKKFLLYDALVSIPWTILLISASYYLSATLDVFAEARQIKHYVFLVLVLAGVSYTAVRFIKGILARS